MANNYPNNYNNPTNGTIPFQPQQLFPQPQGSVFIINNSLEVANVPMGAGLSVAICLPEELVYLKSMQNGNPTFMVYRLTPYTQKEQPSPQTDIEQRISKIEMQMKELLKSNTSSLADLI